jgi:hypothetical protein
MDSQDPSIVYISVDEGGILKGTDCGTNWVRIDNPSDNFSTRGPTAFAWTMASDPVNPNVMYANNGYGQVGLFKTTDGGVTWTSVYGGNVVASGNFTGNPVSGVFIYNGFTASVSMDPTDHLHLVAAPHFSCNPPYSSYCLLETWDGAMTWSVINTPVSLANADGPQTLILGAGRYMIISPSLAIAPTPPAYAYTSTDCAKTWTAVSPSIEYNTDPMEPHVYWSEAAQSYYMCGNVGLYRSTNLLNWSWVQGSPQAFSGCQLTGDGTNLYMNWSQGGAQSFPYYRVSEVNPTTWTTIAADPGMVVGSFDLVADPVNHFIYSTNLWGGIWRYATP